MILGNAAAIRLAVYVKSREAKKYRKNEEYGSGSGKTRYFIKPNLMQCHSSYVVTDPNDVRPDRVR